jgi:hypothetical protein
MRKMPPAKTASRRSPSAVRRGGGCGQNCWIGSAARFDNVRYVDPGDLFCDPQICRPFAGDRVFYRDRVHLLPAGADRILESFPDEFRWLTSEP